MAALETAPERLRVKVQFDGDCWRWVARIDTKGYGQIKVDGRYLRAHRWTYEMFKGPIPDGLQIDHLCRNRWCVNPDHLEPVTRRENMRRAAVLITSCKHGHPYTPETTYIAPGTGRRSCLVCRRRVLAERRDRERKERQREREKVAA